MTLGRRPQHLPKIVLDWKAYYEIFEQLHGTPVRFNGRLLYHDGWQHSATDYAGPEWAPPDDPKELKTLIRAYYRRRLPQLKEEYDILRNQINSIREMQTMMSVPLQQRVRYFDEDRGGYLSKSETVDITPLEQRLQNLEEEVRECESRLHALNETNQETAA